MPYERSHRILLPNILHPQKRSRLATWPSPDDSIHNEVDYVLFPLKTQTSKATNNSADLLVPREEVAVAARRLKEGKTRGGEGKGEKV